MFDGAATMTLRSLDAYDLPERVVTYDASMEIMHPNRTKMVQVALEVLPFEAGLPLRAVDLGVGSGYFTRRFLESYPNARVDAIDSASTMIEFARDRLGPISERVQFIQGDFRCLSHLLAPGELYDVVFTSYALHHLDAWEKERVVRQAWERLLPGGWFINADIIVADSPEVEQRIQDLRVGGIVRRALGIDDRFADATATRQFLDQLEARDGDQPLTLAGELEAARQGGLQCVSCFWLEYREAVWGGTR
jgi:tRNA (cmo5U34)-methyltransferase